MNVIYFRLNIYTSYLIPIDGTFTTKLIERVVQPFCFKGVQFELKNDARLNRKEYT